MTSISAGGSASSPGADNQNKNQKNTSKNYKNKPSPKTISKEPVDPAQFKNLDVKRLLDTGHAAIRFAERTYVTREVARYVLQNPEKVEKALDDLGRYSYRFSSNVTLAGGSVKQITVVLNKALTKIVTLF